MLTHQLAVDIIRFLFLTGIILTNNLNDFGNRDTATCLLIGGNIQPTR
jgi:hypothetical protein